MTRNSVILKRKYQRRPGLKETAEQLGVSYGHLRLCVAGERDSHSLLERYSALKGGAPGPQSQKAPGRYKNSPQKARIPKPPEFAASENLMPEFFAILAKLGLQIVGVHFTAAIDSPIWEHDHIELDLDRALQAVKAGQFDSSYYTLGAQYHFYHVSDLAKAVHALKAALDACGLLKITTIYHAESADEWITYFPGTAQTIKIAEDAEA
jgi:hypothetical protein